MRGASGALSHAIRYSVAEYQGRLLSWEVRNGQGVLIPRSCAMTFREPCQGESSSIKRSESCATRVLWSSHLTGYRFGGGCQPWLHGKKNVKRLVLATSRFFIFIFIDIFNLTV